MNPFNLSSKTFHHLSTMALLLIFWTDQYCHLVLYFKLCILSCLFGTFFLSPHHMCSKLREHNLMVHLVCSHCSSPILFVDLLSNDLVHHHIVYRLSIFSRISIPYPQLHCPKLRQELDHFRSYPLFTSFNPQEDQITF